MAAATFFYDVGDPWCWLAGERLTGTVAWESVHAGSLGIELDADRAAVEAAASAQRQPPLRWPEAWPFDTGLVMRAAAFAKQSGRVVAFSLAAMRQAFLAGRDLSVEDNVLLAGAACELHPRALLAGVEMRATREALRRSTERAHAFGVRSLPALVVGGRVVAGPGAVEAAP